MQLDPGDVVLSGHTPEEIMSVNFRFLGVDLPPDNLSAPDVHEDVGEQEDALDTSREPCDVPTPHLIWTSGLQLGRLTASLCGSAFSSVVEQPPFSQQPVHCTDAGEINPFVQQICIDGVGRNVGVVRTAAHLDKVVTLAAGELSSDSPLSSLATVSIRMKLPPLVGANANLQYFTRLEGPSAGQHSFLKPS
jgi:hypothetical protein